MAGLSNKKMPPRIKKYIHIRKGPSYPKTQVVHLFQPKSRVRDQESGIKDKEKKGSNKPKNKGLSNKLQLYIERSIDMQEI